MLFAIALYSFFQYGFTINYLESSAILIGRQIARESQAENLVILAEVLIEKEGINVDNFHVMRYPIGDREFIQLVLVGRTVRIGTLAFTPSARSLTVVDQW